MFYQPTKSPKFNLPRWLRVISLYLCLTLFLEQSNIALAAGTLDISSFFLRSQITQAQFRPLHLRSLVYDRLNDRLRFIVDKGNYADIKQNLRVTAASQKLIDYLFIGIVLPNKTFWVNLRPDSPEKIIDPALASTDVGKILLESDIQLKKDLASCTNPGTSEGHEYWSRLYQKAEEIYGTSAVTIPTLTRPWITPGEIIVAERDNGAYVYKATLKVMLEEDYLANVRYSGVNYQQYAFKDPREKELNEYSTQLIKELIVPKLTKEVNSSKRYAPLRQVYYSLILAQWFKRCFYGQGGQLSRLIDSYNLAGLTSTKQWDKEKYFKEYKESFSKGEYDTRETAYTASGPVIRSYFSGGISFEVFTGTGNGLAPGVKLMRSSLPNLPMPGFVAEVERSSAPISQDDLVGDVEGPVSLAPVKRASSAAGFSHLQPFSWLLRALPYGAMLSCLLIFLPCQIEAADVTVSHKLVQKIAIHEVQKGDSLKQIAHNYLGERRLWTDVYAYNMHIIGKDPNKIMPGQRLNIIKEVVEANPPLSGQIQPIAAQSGQSAVAPEITPPVQPAIQDPVIQAQPKLQPEPLVQPNVRIENPQLTVSRQPEQNQVADAAIHEEPVLAQQSDQAIMQGITPQVQPEFKPNPLAKSSLNHEISRPVTKISGGSPPPEKKDRPIAAWTEPSARPIVAAPPYDYSTGNSSVTEYYEIIRMGEKRDPNNIGYFSGLLRMHDDTPALQGRGMSLKSVVEITGELGKSTFTPTFNSKTTLGDVFELLNNGFNRLMAKWRDTFQPSKRRAAAYGLGMMAPNIKGDTQWLFGLINTRRAVVDDLERAVLTDKDIGVRQTASWARWQFSLNGYRADDRSIMNLQKALEDPDWLVRYYTLKALSASGNQRALQAVLNLLAKEDNPCVLAVATTAALRLDPASAILPVITNLEKLRFNTEEDAPLYALDASVLSRAAQEMVSFGRLSPQTRSFLIANFIQELRDVQARRDIPGKYDIINFILLPFFEELAVQLKISSGEIKSQLNGIDSRLARTLLNIVEPRQGQGKSTLSCISSADRQYNMDVSLFARDNPQAVQEISALVRQGNRQALEEIVLFSRDASQTPYRVLAAHALVNMPGLSSYRALIAGVQDAHPSVRAGCAKALRDYAVRRPFIYTGKDSTLVKALRKAAESRDLVVCIYLLDTLRSIGGTDALDVMREFISPGTHPLIKAAALEALQSFAGEGTALKQPLINLLSEDTESRVLITAMKSAKSILASSDDPILVDTIVKALMRFPQNPESYSVFAELQSAAFEALRQSNCAMQRLNVMAAEVRDRGDYVSLNLINSLIRGLGGTVTVVNGQNYQGPSLKPNAEVSQALAISFDAKLSRAERINAVSRLGKILIGTSDILVTTHLITLLEKEPDPDIGREAVDVLLKINRGGSAVSYSLGQNKLVEALAKIASDGSGSRSDEIRRAAIYSLGKIGGAQAALKLSQLMLSFKDTSWLLIAVEASCEALGPGYNELLFQSLARIYVTKLNVGPETLLAYPEIVRIKPMVAGALTQHKSAVLTLLEKDLRDRLSVKDPKAYSEDEINAILQLAALVDSQRYPAFAGIALENAIGSVYSGSDSLPRKFSERFGIWRAEQGLTEVAHHANMPQAAESLLLLGELSDKKLAKVRMQAFVRLTCLNFPLFLEPQIIETARRILTDPQEDDGVRTAAAYFCASIDTRFIHHRPGVNQDVLSLVTGINGKDIGFEERFFRVVALGKSRDTRAIQPLNDLRSSLDSLYPGEDNPASSRMQEKRMLMSAVQWGLGELESLPAQTVSGSSGQEAGRVKSETRLKARLDAGEFEYPDTEALYTLRQSNPSAFSRVEARIGLGSVAKPRDPSGLCARYGSNGTSEPGRNIFSMSMSAHTQALGEAYERGWAKANFQNLSEAVDSLFFSPGPDIRVAAAFYLGASKDAAVIGALNSALKTELQRRNSLVSAALLRNLGQFESVSDNAQDVRYSAFLAAWQVINTNTNQPGIDDIQAELAFSLGTSGDERVVPILQELLNCNKPIVQLLAIDSSGKLARKFRSSALIDALIRLGKSNYHFPAEKRPRGELYTPMGQAAMDTLFWLMEEPEFRPLVSAAVRKSVPDNLEIEVPYRNLHPVEQVLLERCDPGKIEPLRGEIWKMWFNHWEDLGILIGGLIAGVFCIWRFIVRPITRHVNIEKNRKPRSSSPTQGSSSPIKSVNEAQVIVSEIFSRLKASRIRPEEREALIVSLAVEEPGTANFWMIRQALRLMHPDDFEQIRALASKPNVPAPVADKIRSIALERSSGLDVGLARANGKINDLKLILKKNKLETQDLIDIYCLCQDIVRVHPLLIGHNSDDLHRRSKVNAKINELIITVLERAIREVDFDANNDRLVKQIAHAGHHFIDQGLVFDFIDDLRQARTYSDAINPEGSVDINSNVRHELWHRLWAIEAMADNALENLAFLLEEIHKSGNEIVPGTYNGAQSREDFQNLARKLYANIQPSSLGVNPKYVKSKEWRRKISLVLGVSSFFVMFYFKGTDLLRHPTIFGFAIPIFTGAIIGFLGFYGSTLVTWWQLKSAWKDELHKYDSLHGKIETLLGEWENKAQPLQMNAVSSPSVNQTPGGIDLIITNSMIRVNKESSPLPRQVINMRQAGEDEELRQINTLIRAGIIPSPDRIEGYLKAGVKSGDLEIRIQEARLCLADIMRLEEMRDDDADAQQIDQAGGGIEDKQICQLLESLEGLKF